MRMLSCDHRARTLGGWVGAGAVILPALRGGGVVAPMQILGEVTDARFDLRDPCLPAASLGGLTDPSMV